MDWLVDRVFPFRRLTVWLGLLLLIVIVLALALMSLLVLPSLEESLVGNRVDTVARSAEQSAPTFQSNFENALTGAPGSPDTDAVTAAYGHRDGPAPGQRRRPCRRRRRFPQPRRDR